MYKDNGYKINESGKYTENTEDKDSVEPTGCCVVCGDLVYDQNGNLCDKHKSLADREYWEYYEPDEYTNFGEVFHR
jgi:hypothetical protein